MYEFKLPDLGEGLFDGEIVRWLIKEGDNVKEDQNVLEIETAKALVEIPCPKSGIVKKIFFKAGDVVKIGQPLFAIDTGEEEAEEVAELSRDSSNVNSVLATPKVRKLARDLHIDLSQITGTGNNGRITEEDINSFSQAGKADDYSSLPIERIKLQGIRKQIAESIAKSVYTIPQATVMHDAIATKLVAFREKIKKSGEKKKIKVTYLPFIVKAVVESLKKHQSFNSTLEGEEIIIKKFYNIGIAVDTIYGVVVPVIKNADKKTIFELAKEMEILSEKAREKKLSLEDVRGGTFTITNVGAVGSKMSTPIINYPECAILAIHRIRDSAVVIDGKITIQKVMPMAITFDHRIVDGAQAARFMEEVIKLLEEPGWMEIEL